MAQARHVLFEWGTSTSYGSEITAQNSPISSTSLQSVYANLTNLTPGATYHYRVVATNSAGTSQGGDISFTTPLVDAFWVNTNNGMISGDVHSLAVNSQNHIFAGMNNSSGKKGVYRSKDGGKTWTAINTNMIANSVTDIAINSSGHIFLATNPDGVFRSTDNGDTWTQINTNLHNRQVNTIAIDADNRIFVGCEDWGIFRSTDNGDTWTRTVNGMPALFVTTIDIDGQGGIYTGTRNEGIYYSGDHGSSWSARNKSLELSSTDVLTLAFGETSVVYAGIWNAGIYRSTDSGSNWQPLNMNSKGSLIRKFLNVENEQLYGITWGSRTVYRSLDGGGNWDALDAGLDDTYARCIAMDSSGYLYLGTWTGGVYKSAKPVTSPKPALSIQDATNIDIDAATLNGSVNAKGSVVTVAFEYGPTLSYGNTTYAIPSSVSDTFAVSFSADITGLTANITYHCRAVVIMSDNTHLYSSDKSFTTPAFSQKERRALIALYNSTNGDNWTNAENKWKAPPVSADGFHTAEFEWFGIKTAGSHVSEIVLTNNNLAGTLPDEIGDFPYLNELWLNINYVSGKIPDKLGYCANLVELWLSHNQLNGTVPSELQNLKKLHYFCVDYNELTGAIPEWIGTFPELASMEWQGNQFSGVIPSEIGNLPLGKLHLTDNQLSGEIPSSITNLQKTMNSTEFGLSFNMLESNNQVVMDFLDSYSRDWEKTQTVPPKNITASLLSPSSIRLNWTPIAFKDSVGHYRIYFGTEAGAYSDSVVTNSKSDSVYTFSNLNYNTTYYFRIKSFTAEHGPYAKDPYPVRPYQQNDLLSVYSQEISCKTGILKPVVTTSSADSITNSTAVLHGSVNPNGNEVMVRFEYGITTDYGDSVLAEPTPVSGSVVIPVRKIITGLSANTTYHYRILATNASFREHGSDLSFTTTSLAQQVATPTFDIQSGLYYAPIEVAISCLTPGAIIRYTLDNSEPTESSAVYSTSAANYEFNHGQSESLLFQLDAQRNG